MAKEQFIFGKKLQAKTLEKIMLIDGIIREYMDNGIVMSVRQLYYQLVSRGHIENTQENYGKLDNWLNLGRLYGLIDWSGIEDRTRGERAVSHWDNPQKIIYSAARCYAIDKRADQPNYIEAWVEKDALIGVLEPLAKRYDLVCFSCRGYPSTTTMKDAAERFIAQEDKDARIILYAGDHDPSGFDICRSIQEKMQMFGADVDVRRIGLTMEQIETYNPPPNVAKETDKRWRKYVEQYGKSSWELDALDPKILSDLYAQEIEELTDNHLYQAAKEREQDEIRQLETVYKNWNSFFQA